MYFTLFDLMIIQTWYKWKLFIFWYDRKLTAKLSANQTQVIGGLVLQYYICNIEIDWYSGNNWNGKKEKMRNNESAYPLFTPLYFLLCCTLETVSLGFPR